MSGRIRMNAPLKILAERLREKGFWKPTKTGPVAQAITRFMSWPIKELILRYRAILNGILQYYSFVNNRGSLAYVYYLLHGSLRNTICRKLNIGVREFYAIYGPKITMHIFIPKTKKWVDLDFPLPSLVAHPMDLRFKGAPEHDPFAIKDWKVSTLTALGQCCANCASFPSPPGYLSFFERKSGG